MEMDFIEEFTPVVLDNKQRFYMDKRLANMTLETLNEDAIFDFFYDYIQGSLLEYKESEGLYNSYIIGQNWRRRLNQDPNQVAVFLNTTQVGKLQILTI